jgi:protein arginine kinase activator
MIVIKRIIKIVNREGGNTMLCDKCHKREAKIYYTEITNGEKKEQHLCEECATEYTSFQLESVGFNKEISIGDLLSSILGNYNIGQTVKQQNISLDIKCNTCGMTYEEFQNTGKFGCADCYKSFGKALEKNLKQIQGFDTHVGKKPQGFANDFELTPHEFTEMEKLSIWLQDAIEKEEFEDAAKFRDAIKALKNKEGANNA